MGDTLIIGNKFLGKLEYNFFNSNNIDFLSIDWLLSNDINHLNSILYKNEKIYEYKNIIIVLSIEEFSYIHATGNPANRIDIQIDTFKNIDVKSNWNNFISKFSKDIKIVYIDDIPEEHYCFPTESILDFLNSSNNTYVITSRFKSIIHDRMISNLIYLPIRYSFFQHNIFRNPKLDYSFPSNPKYNFITYLGQSHKPEKIEARLSILNKIFKNNLQDVKYKENSDWIINDENLGQAKVGHVWNLLSSLSAKLQVIFETQTLTQEYSDYYYLTEKTMKLFLLPHPYVLLVHSSVLNELENYGFRFSYKCNNLEEYIDLFTKILNDIDGWINKNQEDFYHNHENFYQMANSSELPHHLFLKSLIEL